MNEPQISPSPTLEAFFDFACPWSWVAFNRANEAAMRTLSMIEWRPVQSVQLAERLPELSSSSALEQQAAERHWLAWLDYCGLQTARSFSDTVDSRQALLAALYATEAGLEGAFVGDVFAAYWEQGKNIADPSVLLNLAGECGLNTEELQDWLGKGVVSDALDRNLDQFIELNGYKTPGFRVGDSLFMGNEQMPLVELALGQASDLGFVMPGSHGWDGEVFERTADGSEEADPV